MKGAYFLCSLFLKIMVMKNLAFLLSLLISGLLFSQGNSVVVNGKTNVNTFKCTHDKFNQASNNYSFKKDQLPYLQLEVNHFDCKNRIMTQDLRKTLKADHFPTMYVRFLSFQKVSEKQYTATIEVKLTGKIRNYTTSFYPVNNTLVGREYVRFSDFGLKAPTKMGGMIVVEDQLNLILTLNHL
ncbi:hypothetical protein DQ356_00845 [Chryseobacterium lacus]|uniref:YceI family protein n=2 Tax=Chryseobacterium lacus TaxID=2058346 RepID=A0A368N5I9_9FLAO|nr:hypothetical protein DQ356_00845 [Chryseobacterium lacus]